MENEELLRLIEIEQELLKRREKDLLGSIDANARQRDFINADSKETMLTGANQAGKSTALMMKFTYHMTGIRACDSTSRSRLRWEGRLHNQHVTC